jgi:hypothetical protein
VKNQPQKIEQVLPESGDGLAKRVIDPRYRGMTCYNCGKPGHFVGICTKPKICFICAVPGHYMNECQFWKKSQLAATYLGNAGESIQLWYSESEERGDLNG